MPAHSTLNSTQNALLGLLSIKPMSGYDIRQLIPESIGHFWSESYGQIYPALRGMMEAGLVMKHTAQAAGRPDRNVYTLTEAGQETIRDWLTIPPRSQPVRNELLLKLFFGAHAHPSASIEHVRAFLAAQCQELGTYEAVSAHLQREHARNPNLPFWLITLSRGRHDAQAGIAWARETLTVLERLLEAASTQLPDQPTHQGETTYA